MAFGKPGDQLRLFAPANEIVQSLFSGGIGSKESVFHSNTGRVPIPGSPHDRETNIRLLNDKKNEAAKPAGAKDDFGNPIHGAGLYDKIAKEGFQGHIQLDLTTERPKIWEGHHRLGAAHDLGEQFVGLDYVSPNNPDDPEWRKPSYQERYPQNP